MNAPNFPGWLAASLGLAASVWAVDQYNRHYAWSAAILAVLSVLVVRVQTHPETLTGLYVPWSSAPIDPGANSIVGPMQPAPIPYPNLTPLVPPAIPLDPATPF